MDKIEIYNALERIQEILDKQVIHGINKKEAEEAWELCEKLKDIAS